MRKEQFGITKDGKCASKYILNKGTGMEVIISDFGAIVQSIFVEDKRQEKRDVVLGFDTLEEYYNNDYGFGAYIGRNANRIQDARVILEGEEYLLEANDNGNNLHSGSKRSYYQLYEAVTGENAENSFVQLERTSPHLEQGFPGNLKQKIRYTLTDKNQLVIDYEMESDQTTVVNPTNHSYFNLEGHDGGNILSHELEIYSDEFLPTDEKLIPTGEIRKVMGTPMDFCCRKPVGKEIHEQYLPLQAAGGYDHNYVLKNDGKLKRAARLYSPQSGIFMKVYTDLCGMQLYSGNFLNGEKGKRGAVYNKHAGICFETQFYPNACKEPKFPSSVLEAGRIFRSRTIYEFGTKK